MSNYFAALIDKTAGRSAIRMKNERVYGPAVPPSDAAPAQPLEQQAVRPADAPELPPAAAERAEVAPAQSELRDDAAALAGPLPQAPGRPTPGTVSADPPVVRPTGRDFGTMPVPLPAPAADDRPGSPNQASVNSGAADIAAADTPNTLVVVAEDLSPASPEMTVEALSPRRSLPRPQGTRGQPPQVIADGSATTAAPPDQPSAAARAANQPVDATIAERGPSAIVPSTVAARSPGYAAAAPDQLHRREVFGDPADPAEGAAPAGPELQPPTRAILRPGQVRGRGSAAQEEHTGPGRPAIEPGPDHVVEVRIGRIDIRQSAQPTPPSRPPRLTAAPRLNLSDYLRRRASEGRGE